MKKTIIVFITLLFVITCGLSVMQYVDYAITQHEQNECKLWQQQAIDYANVGYYLTDWQIKQCEIVGYPIKVAPVVPRKDFNL